MTLVTTNGLVDQPAPETVLQDVQWAVATGSVNSILAAYPEPVTALVDGLILAFRATGANTSTTPVFAPDGLTPHTITQRGGEALSAGSIPAAGAECFVRYNLANTRWELMNPSAGGWTAYTPTLLTSTGTLTSASASGRYKRSGKTVTAVISIAIVTNGSAAGWIAASLPSTPAFASALSGFNLTNSTALTGYCNPSSGYAIAWKYDATYPGANSTTLILTVTYEEA